MSEAAPTVVVPCPRCKKPLVDPDGLGWCKACGFCRSLAEGEAKTRKTAAPVAAEPNTLTATGGAILETPFWFWITLVGCVVIVIATIVGERFLKLTDLQRALFTTLQIVAGVLVMFVGQIIGLMRVAPDDPTISFKDVVFPFRLYALIFKRLPVTQYALYLGVWGMTAILIAAIVVGGLGHWFTYLPQKTPGRSYEVTKLPRG